MNEINEELDQQAADIAYGTRPLDYPCVYGHFDCSWFEGGPCANERCARIYGELLAACQDGKE